jgi:hypothetical protein
VVLQAKLLQVYYNLLQKEKQKFLSAFVLRSGLKNDVSG